MGILITTLQSVLVSRPPMVFTVDPSKVGGTGTPINHFKLPLISAGSYDFTVDWGDNSESDRITTWNDPKIEHDYGDSQLRTVTIKGRCSRFAFEDRGDKLKLINLQKWGHVGLTSMAGAFKGCSNMVLTATDHADAGFGSILSFFDAFYGCSRMTGEFPLLDTSSVKNFAGAWYGCSGLTGFPKIITSAALTVNLAWFNCTGLTQFPEIDTSNVTNFQGAWYQCTNLTSFPRINTANGINFESAWRTCRKLRAFPEIVTTLATTFKDCWNGCTDLGLDSDGKFPLIAASNVTSFWAAWYNCSRLTSFPAIVLTEDENKNVELQQAWAGCYRLATFPEIKTVRVNSMPSAWSGCTGLTAFPSINTSNVTNFSNTWNGCTGLQSFPALTTSKGANFQRAWFNCHSLYSVMPIFDMRAMTNGDLCFPTLSTAIYNSILDQLANGRGAIPANDKNSVPFGAAGSLPNSTSGGYDGMAARSHLETVHAWSISDGAS